jgi:hypothetical protein
MRKGFAASLHHDVAMSPEQQGPVRPDQAFVGEGEFSSLVVPGKQVEGDTSVAGYGPLVLNLKLHELPAWRQDNPEILGHFRATKGYNTIASWKHASLSIFYIHNETFNIWSHFVGALLYLWLGVQHALRSSPEQPFLMMMPFYVGAVACFGGSAVYHTSFGISERALSRYSKLDYMGIVAVIW